MKTRVGVIFGGRSGEHEISIRSAMTVIEQIDHEKYDVVPVAITNDGVWLDAEQSLTFYRRETEERRETGDERQETPFSLQSPVSGLLSPVPSLLSPVSLDVVFPVLHGTFGEDGTIQGLFEMADLPYVGCGVLASSCGMDKAPSRAGRWRCWPRRPRQTPRR